MQDQLFDFWAKVMARLSQKISRPSYETWFVSIEPVNKQDGTLTISSPNDFARDWLDSRYCDQILEAAGGIDPSITSVHIVTREKTESAETADYSSRDRVELSVEMRLERIERQLSEVLDILKQ